MADTIKLEDVVYREDLYPRQKLQPGKVQQYAEDTDVLPPIELNQDNILIDGWHRWNAHKKAGKKEIAYVVTETADDVEILELAIERNAKHGEQLSIQEKKQNCYRIYKATPAPRQGKKKERLASIMAVTRRTINSWLARIDKDSNEQRNAAVQSLHLACCTQTEIAEQVGMTQQGVGRVLQQIEEFQIGVIPGQFADGEPPESATDKVKKEFEALRNQKTYAHNLRCANHEIDLVDDDGDFAVPIYNIWKQQQKTDAGSHFGNSEVTLVDRLLYLYTNPFDIVVDPFAGSGSTLDVCRRRFRRCWVSDRAPIPERQDEIRSLDLTSGLPDLAKNWANVSLVYLDPPYWKQAAGQYSDDPTDLANMPLDEFNKTLSEIIKAFAKKLTDAYIALIIQPTQWKAPDRQFTDHVGDMLRAVNLPVDMRYSAPYESQQCTAQMVEWAKEHRQTLVLTREIIVWKV